MKTMSIYEPAMCCETGICGVGVDPELLRISTVFHNLQKNGITASRFNLNSAPQAFINNTDINKLIMGDGVGSLPATVIDGKIVKTKAYPTNEEIAAWLEIPASYLEAIETKKSDGGCCCAEGCCQ
ncbi:arsenite efflux transporter metallochaperone ArsD [Kineothrix sedimenti]|uniref:Arsenite efflux transporter metallochaperone ArsD n=1 Tax=Kineothrix sedimenti TaxID=3123317 RepID=A0ABZ3F1G1_9FIRM